MFQYHTSCVGTKDGATHRTIICLNYIKVSTVIFGLFIWFRHPLNALLNDRQPKHNCTDFKITTLAKNRSSGIQNMLVTFVPQNINMYQLKMFCFVCSIQIIILSLTVPKNVLSMEKMSLFPFRLNDVILHHSLA